MADAGRPRFGGPGFARRADFGGKTALVCGARVAGASAARALLALGARVLVADSGPVDPARGLPPGVEFLGGLTALPPGVQVVVTSPGLRADHPLLVEAFAAGLPVLGELEFAWRIGGEHPARWLMITGTNGKTTTVRMLESMLTSGGRRALAVGNVGVPIIDAVMAEPGFDILAVEASSFQLEHSASLAPHAGALLNLAPDHLDRHVTMSAYAAQKAKVWQGEIAIANADDPLVVQMLAERPAPAAPVVTFTLGPPADGQYGVRAGQLVDGQGISLIAVDEIRPAGAHNVANALAAAALAATVGTTPLQIAAGLRAFVPDPHRNQLLARVGEVDYIDDSKATNPHAAAASLAARPSVVWIAGGQLKQAPVEDLVREFAARLRGVVLLGVDRDVIAAALARHAPDVPVITVARTDDMAMQEVVRAAASLAAAGDAVLLAPAAASLDMFASYGARGEAFARAVAELPGEREW